MYAIVEFLGFQFKVAPAQSVRVPRVEADVGSEILLDKVLAYSDGEAVEVGKPYLTGRGVKTRVVRHGRGKKVVVFKYKRRKDYRRKRGHRTDFTELAVEEFV